MAYAPNGQPLAGFGDRFIAYLIDTAILTGVGLLLAVPMFFALFAVIAGATSQIETDPATGQVTSSPSLAVFGLPLLIELGWILLVFAMMYVYHVEMFGRTGITVGKRAMKLGIIRGDNLAAPVNRGVLARRFATQVLPGFVVPFWSLIDGLWQLWDKPYQQCLHDKAAGTIVVKIG